MEVLLYEFINALLTPFTLFYLLTLAALLNLWRWPREKPRRLLLLTAAFVGLTMVCNPTVAYLALGSLEWHYPPADERPEDLQVIVVLSAGLLPPDGPRSQAELDADGLQRCLHTARLYHQGPACKVIVSGGKVDPDAPGPPVARVMADLLIQLGVKEADLVIEDTSRTTYENALECAKLLREGQMDRAVLVTDAVDMYRAERCFGKQGIEVIPSPCHYRATSCRFTLRSLLPTSGAAGTCYRVWHEWLGTLWYWLHGRI
jgi:uncharacterized SAM-binding protein YcdF (DUF218 family)